MTGIRTLLLGMLALPLILGSAPPRAAAQGTPVRWFATAERTHRDSARFTLSARLAPGWHVYSPGQGPGGPVAMRVTALAPATIVGSIDAPTPNLALDRSFGIVTETYEGAVSFRGIVMMPAAGALSLRIRYQACDDRVCLPPTTEDVSAEVGASAGSGKTTLARPPSAARRSPASDPAGRLAVPPPVESPLASASASAPIEPSPAKAVLALGPGASIDGPWAPFLWMAAAAGLMALLTPCVFPMVPITVAWFTRDGRSGGSALREALKYALGIVVAFVVLGTSVAALFGAAGINRFASSPWLNAALGAAFTAFALSLMGVFAIRLPSGLANRLSPAAGRPASTMAAALVFTITSFTCTAPFVGTLLVAGVQGSWVRGVAGITLFAAVFALPFVILAAAPSLLARLPGAGAWMVDLKVVLGVAELCAAVKFFANAGQVLRLPHVDRGGVLAAWVVLCVALAAWMTLAPSGGRRSRRRRAIGLIPLALALWLGAGIGGRPLGEVEAFLPAARDDRWITDDYDAALREALATGRPVFADFSGYTCTNCRWMETNMFPEPQVARALGGFVRLRLYTDGRGRPAERAQAMQRSTFRTVALPLYAVIDGTGRPIASFLGMTRDRAEFVDFLERARSR